MDWQTLLDETAERLERRGAADLASICDAVGAHVSEPRVTALLDYVADELERRGETALASRIDEANETVATTVAADTVLRESAPAIFSAVQQYGAQGYAVQGDTVELNVDRGGVQTLMTLAFASRDDQGNPRLRMAFRCGEDQMVRWATLAELTPERITEAVGHVCTTGTDFGAPTEVQAHVVQAIKPEWLNPIQKRIDTYVDRIGARIAQLNSDVSVVYSKIRQLQRAMDTVSKAVQKGDSETAYVVVANDVRPTMSWLHRSTERLDPDFKKYKSTMRAIFKDLPNLSSELRTLIDLSTKASTSVSARDVRAARDELPMGDEKTHYWPQVAGWDGTPDAADALGYAYRYEYEYDEDPGLNVVFDASNFDKVKNTRPGTWDAKILGAKVSGTWTSEKDILGVLKKLVAQFNKAKAKRISDIGQALPKIPGWELLWSKSDPEDANYSKQPEWNSDFSISVTFHSVLDSEGGYKTWMASLSDYGGYERAKYLDDDGRWDKLTDIPKILKRFEQDVEKYRQKRGW